MKNKQRKSNYGTKEWAVKTVNCCTGCSHDCRYCYAKCMALRFKRLTADQWPLERLRPKDVNRIYKKYDGQVMFPSSHDITPNNLDGCLTTLKCLIVVGNRLLVVSKPHLECIKKFCKMFRPYRRRILLRFSIGTCDDRILSFWEPNAPTYDERKASLMYAYEAGFQTSVSAEPMLDSANIDLLISDLSPCVTDSIWIGKMNHQERFGKGADSVLQQAINDIERGQTDTKIKGIYLRHKDNSIIKWKDSIRKVIGI